MTFHMNEINGWKGEKGEENFITNCSYFNAWLVWSIWSFWIVVEYAVITVVCYTLFKAVWKTTQSGVSDGIKPIAEFMNKKVL